VLKAHGEQSVTLIGTAKMQLWCVGNWDTLPLVSTSYFTTVKFSVLTFVMVLPGATPYSDTRFGSGSGPIWLDSPLCTGNENNLLNCSHRGIGVTSYSCGHDNDVGVQCPGKNISISSVHLQ